MAAEGNLHLLPGVQANANMGNAGISSAAAQFYVVQLSANDTVGLGNATAVPAGILQNKPGNGYPAEVAYAGRSKGFFGAAITAGNLVTTDANGCLTTVSNNTYIVGRCVGGAGANEIGDVEITLAGKYYTI